MHTRHTLSLMVAVGLVILGTSAHSAYGQMGILTAAIGSGQVASGDAAAADWHVGQSIHEGDRITTSAGAFAMLFFAGELGLDDLNFSGTIVVEIDQDSTVEIRRGSGRRAPIIVYVIKGRVRAFFDAGEHKDYILLSTPLGEMRATGSIIYATHDLPDFAGTVFGSFDSDCEIRLHNGIPLAISRAQKAILAEGSEGRVEALTAGDQISWEALPDLNLASALAHRGQVRTAYADQTWVGGWVAGVERLEDVASDAGSNIPSQEPELVVAAPSSSTRTTDTSSRETRPRLRASGSGRSAGDEEGGFGRETLGVSTAARRTLSPTLDSRASRLRHSGRSVRTVQGTSRSSARR